MIFRLKSLLKKRIYRIIFYILIFSAVFEILFFVVIKPLVIIQIEKGVSAATDDLYSLKFSNININFFNGSIRLYDFKLVPDISKSYHSDRHLYEIGLDTFYLKHLNISAFFSTNRKIRIGELLLASPDVKVYAFEKKGNRYVLKNKKTFSLDTFKIDLQNIFKGKFSKFRVKKMKISSASFDFLKNAGFKTANSFSIGNFSIEINGFHIDSESIRGETFFADKIIFLVDNYKLYLRDGKHILIAKSLKINTKEKTVVAHKVRLYVPGYSVTTDTSKSTVLDFYLPQLTIKGYDLDRIYREKIFHLSSASITGLQGIVYKGESKHKKFNKDTLIQKLDLYRLFKGFFTELSVDTITVSKSSFKLYDKRKALPVTDVANMQLFVDDFVIDSTSGFVSDRVLFSKNIEMWLFGVNERIGQEVISADYIVVSTLKSGFLATNLKIQTGGLYKLSRKKLFNDYHLDISSINLDGFDLKKYVNKNKIVINRFSVGKSDLSMFLTANKKQKSGRFLRLLTDFAKEINVKKIDFAKGELNVVMYKNAKRTQIRGKYQLAISDFAFDVRQTNLKRKFRSKVFDGFITDLFVKLPDSLYEITSDSIYYSSSKSLIKFVNFHFTPLQTNLKAKLLKYHKQIVFDVHFPEFSIRKTNLIKSFETDSLYLNRLELLSPKFTVTQYPDLNVKELNNDFVKSIKKQKIIELDSVRTLFRMNLFSQSDLSDSVKLALFKQKQLLADSLLKIALSSVIDLKIKSNTVNYEDSIIPVLDSVCNMVETDIGKIAVADTSVQKIFEQSYQTLQRIVDDYKKPKITFSAVLKGFSFLFSHIVSDTLRVSDGDFLFKISTKDYEKVMFSTGFDLFVKGFNYDSTTVAGGMSRFFSDYIKFTLHNTVLQNLDNQKIEVDETDFNLKDSLFWMSGLRVKDKKNSLRFEEIRLSGVNYFDIFIHKRLYANSLLMSGLNIDFYYKGQKKVKNREVFKLPQELKKVFIRNILLTRGNMTLWLKDSNAYISTRFLMKFGNFKIDSVYKPRDEKFYLPVSSFFINFYNFKSVFLNKNVRFYNLVLDSKDGKIVLDSVFYNDLKGQKYLDFTNFSAIGLRYDYLKKKQIVWDSASISDLFLSMTLKKDSNHAKFDLKKIDVYESIKNKFNYINGNYLGISNIAVKINKAGELKEYRNYDLILTGIKIDSTSKFLDKNLFYCNNILFVARNQVFEAGDSIRYRYRVGKLEVSTGKNQILIDNLKFYPSTGLKNAVKDKFWRTTVVNLVSRRLKISDIDFYKILVDSSVKIGKISGDSIFLEAYTDLRKPHNYKHLAGHLISPVLNFKYPLFVDSIELADFNVKYFETVKKNNKTAWISIDSSELRVVNLTNIISADMHNFYTTMIFHGLINKKADFNLKVSYNLKLRGDSMRVEGHIGRCPASLFNTYTQYGAGLLLERGTIQKMDFEFGIKDSISLGKMKMYYTDLKTYIVKTDSVKAKKLKFLSWLVDLLVLKNSNPKYGLFLKVGTIAYIHDKSFGDFKFWVKSLLSGVRSTVVFDSKDVKRIKRIKRRNAKLMRKKKELFLD